MQQVQRLREQAQACADMGSPMYADLMHRVADDLAAGGPARDVLAGHESDPGPSALGLRLLGSVHRLVLDRRAGELAAYYPSVGGTWEPEAGWAAFRRVLRDDPEGVREWLDRPPQTNEVGRSGALYGGLLQLGDGLPVRLFEIGASAGLNLRADRFTFVDDVGRRFGAPGEDLVLSGAWRGRSLAPGRVEIVERLGADLRPVDPTTPEGRLLLTAYVWPDQQDRLERLRAAFQIAAEVPAEVREEPASAFVDGLELRDGTTTVLWHSVVWQYLAPVEKEAVTSRIEELGARATDHSRFARLRMEPSRRRPGAAHEFLVWLRTWPDGDERLLGSTLGHGVPTTWE